MRIKLAAFGLTILLSGSVYSQQAQMSPAEIYTSLQKLQETTRVLYIAAHPDDENTRLLTWLSKGRHFETAYLSLTRGDGGQNLIGDEQGALLGVVRTQELLAARSVDGTRQYFSRAIDFGYSKSAEEALSTWGHDEILSDVVWVIRQFQPDVIITRFPPDARAGHGHHTASAMLAVEAFDLAADPAAFPEQLQWCKPWQVQRVLWNASSWWDNTLPDQVDGSSVFSVDVGAYDPMLGTSYGELAGKARSQHRSQGFGVSPYRGEQMEYLKLLKGNPPAGTTDPLAADDHWSELSNGDMFSQSLEQLIGSFDMKAPAGSLNDLVELYTLLDGEEQEPQVIDKRNHLVNLIAATAGLWLEPVVTDASENQVEVVSECLSAAGLQARLIAIGVADPGKGEGMFPLLDQNGPIDRLADIDVELPGNVFIRDTFTLRVADNANATPYWMTRPYTSTYQSSETWWRGSPVWDELPRIIYEVQFGDVTIPFSRRLVDKEIDPARGEYYVPVQLLPEFHVHIQEQLCLFRPGAAGTVHVAVDGLRAETTGSIRLEIPEGWTISPSTYDVNGNERSVFTFSVRASEQAVDGMIKPVFETGGKIFDQEISDVIYDHIPEQHIVGSSARKAIILRMHASDGRYAYIEGAGDLVLESLLAAGMDITELKIEDISSTDLSAFDAIVTGVRAYNISERLIRVQPALLQYVQNGGNLLIQYNTTNSYTRGNDPDGNSMGPYALSLGRGRTTDEKARPEFLLPDHPVFNTPNKITTADFDGWVQERGLYYVNTRDDHYVAPLGFADPGEEVLDGSLVITQYGKGQFIYTGLSFFRQLPAGVPGAYKLFYNLLSLESANEH